MNNILASHLTYSCSYLIYFEKYDSHRPSYTLFKQKKLMAFLENCSVIPRKTAVVKPMPTKKDKTARKDLKGEKEKDFSRFQSPTRNYNKKHGIKCNSPPPYSQLSVACFQPKWMPGQGTAVQLRTRGRMSPHCLSPRIGRAEPPGSLMTITRVIMVTGTSAGQGEYFIFRNG